MLLFKKNLNDPYHDYIPMKTQNIITKYLRESNQNAGTSESQTNGKQSRLRRILNL